MKNLNSYPIFEFYDDDLGGLPPSLVEQMRFIKKLMKFCDTHKTEHVNLLNTFNNVSCPIKINRLQIKETIAIYDQLMGVVNA